MSSAVIREKYQRDRWDGNTTFQQAVRVRIAPNEVAVVECAGSFNVILRWWRMGNNPILGPMLFALSHSLMTRLITAKTKHHQSGVFWYSNHARRTNDLTAHGVIASWTHVYVRYVCFYYIKLYLELTHVFFFHVHYTGQTSITAVMVGFYFSTFIF